MSGEFEHLPAALLAFFGIVLFVAVPLFLLIVWALKSYYAWDDRNHARRMEEKLRQSFRIYPPRPWESWDHDLLTEVFDPSDFGYERPRHVDGHVVRVTPNKRSRS